MPVLVNEIPLNGSPEPGSVLASTAKPIVRVDGEILASSGAEPVSLRTEDAVHGLERCQLTLAGAAAEPLRWYDPLLNALASLLRPGGGAARRLRGPAGIGGPVAIFDRSALDFGAELSVAFPSGDGEVVVFDGVITGLEGRFRADRAETLTVHAESRLIDLAMSQSTRNFEDDSVTGIVERIATFHSMETEVDLEDDVYRRYVAQLNQSDLDFLRQLAQFVDADIWMAGDALHVQSRRLRDPNPIDLVLGSSLGRFDALADLREQRTELTVGGEDVAAGNWLRVAANPGPVSGELGAGQDGASVLSEALGERLAHLGDITVEDEEEAQRLVQSLYARRARRFVTGRGHAAGEPLIQAGRRVDIDGVAAMFTGLYHVTASRHVYDQAEGYRTEFEVERATLAHAD